MTPSLATSIRVSSLKYPAAHHFLLVKEMNGSSSKDLRLDSPPAQNPHCFPETHSPDIHDFGTGDSYPSAGKLPNLDFTPTNEGSLLGSIHTRIAALRTSSADTQNRHSQAANTLVPAEPDWGGMRTSTKNSLWNSTGFFAEGETASQLLRYREVCVLVLDVI